MRHALGLLLALTMLLPAVAQAQERVGVATSVVGPVTVTHVATSPAPLKFKDDVMRNDRITTGEQAFARVLLGGKAIVTARERSVITITEAPGTSTIDLVSGRISVAVDKSRIREGEVVEIKTPNAVSGIRGTIVVAEAVGNVSRITVLRGLVDVYRRDPVTGGAVGPATPVGVRESVTVRANVLPARPQTISPEVARGLSSAFTPPVRPVSPATGMVGDEVTKAKDLIGTLAPAAAPGRNDAVRVDPLQGKADSKPGATVLPTAATLPTLGGDLGNLAGGAPAALAGNSGNVPDHANSAPTNLTSPTQNALKHLLKK